MVSWITHEDWHRLKPGLDYKFDVAMSGVLGIGYDITKWTEDEKKLAKEKIAKYKEIRNLVQFGTLHRLVSPFENNKSALEYIADDHSTAVVFCYNMAEYLNGSIEQTQEANVLKLRGLDPGARYTIPELNKAVYKGDFLMNVGIPWPVKGAYKSMILQIQKLK
jgi:alpha-galactosidase